MSLFIVQNLKLLRLKPYFDTPPLSQGFHAFCVLSSDPWAWLSITSLAPFSCSQLLLLSLDTFPASLQAPASQPAPKASLAPQHTGSGRLPPSFHSLLPLSQPHVSFNVSYPPRHCLEDEEQPPNITVCAWIYSPSKAKVTSPKSESSCSIPVVFATKR